MPTLMVSVSGIRGIIGDGLEPEVLVKYTSAYADFTGTGGKIVLGSDGRISGGMVKNIVAGTLMAKGFDVIDIGICPTPTVLYTVKQLKAAGGIQLSASHNPNEWNALKLLNDQGEFMTPEENAVMLTKLDNGTPYKKWDSLGKLEVFDDAVKKHKEDVLKLPGIDVNAIRNRRFKVLLDSVNGAGSYIMPELLNDLGCEVIELNCEKTGIFPRLPEPIPENLTEAMEAVKKHGADIGVIVDPDVDRLVLITDQGEPFIEENTISNAVRFVLSKTPGNVVVNLSTTRAVDDIAKKFGASVYRSPVGEANVVKLMKETDAVIGGEGSGGVIYPALHYGRDALVGTVITLQSLLEFGGTMSELKKALPQYHITKTKVNIAGKNPDDVLKKMIDKYGDQKINTDDGVRIDFDDHWVHFRKSNTEPIIRCIAEAATKEKSENAANKYLDEIKSLL